MADDGPDYGYGRRWDEANQSYSGPNKGLGFLGPLRNANGKILSELSIDGEINGQPTQYPSVVPTLTKDELTKLLNLGDNGRVPASIQQKAAVHAKQRIDAGLDPFAQEGEQQNLYPDLPRMPLPPRANQGGGIFVGDSFLAQPPMAVSHAGAVQDAVQKRLMGGQ
jgi:hypothetical protein